MFKKIIEKYEQKKQEEQAHLEEMLRIERERLLSLSEKELLVETILELRKITESYKDISAQCDSIAAQCDSIASQCDNINNQIIL